MRIANASSSGRSLVPASPTVNSVTVVNATTVSIAFTAPFSKLPVTNYTVTSSPSIPLSTSGTSSPLTVTGAFVPGQTYTFTISAANLNGLSQASSQSPNSTPAPLPSSASDNFNRTTSGNLGTANTGGDWEAVSGVWSANGSVATTSTAASLYPISTLELVGSTVDASATVTGGTGLVFWLSDANNWWAAYPFYSSTSSTGSQCVAYTEICSGNVNCVPANCCSAIISGNPDSNPITRGSPWRYCLNTFQNVTTTTYNSQIKLDKNVSGIVSNHATYTHTSNTSGYTTVNSMSVTTSGDTITVKAYSGSNLTSQVGSNWVQTPSSPTKGRKVGILRAPTTANQGSTVDNFSATAS